jgi:hypothetical protein
MLEAHITSAGVLPMNVDLDILKNLIRKRTDEIEKIVSGTGYLARTVIGVGTFLLDNEGNIDLLSAKQRVTFEKFLEPLLAPLPGSSRKDPARTREEKAGSGQ